MNADMLSPVIALFLLVKVFYKFQSLEEEIRMYGDTLEEISALLSDVVCTRKRLSAKATPEVREKADREIRRTELALEEARRAVGWSDTMRSEAGAVVERMKWAFKYTDAARVHMESLNRCHSRLVSIGDELAKANERRPWLKKRYFQEIQANAITSLARQAIGHATAYSGPGEHVPQLRCLGA
ncbi:MAG: hypothetical protein M1840_004830 [Geoglossum simile]|nr:MAG: hypothetical protein M1840_004830 [Geoglossum simile]